MNQNGAAFTQTARTVGSKLRGSFGILTVCAVVSALVLWWIYGQAAQLEWNNPWALWALLSVIPVLLADWWWVDTRSPRAMLARPRAAVPAVSGWQSRTRWAPTACRCAALCCLVFASAQPRAYHVEAESIDSIDIMFVLDLSKSMEAQDLPRDRLDAAQRVIREFARKRKNDRMGLVVFARQAAVASPLTSDLIAFDHTVADLAIGDVAEYGTAIGDGLGLALATLRRSTTKAKIAIVLSDGDSNVARKFRPDEAAVLAKEMNVAVFTVLIGDDRPSFFSDPTVNPETLRNIALQTGGQFFVASDQMQLETSFESLRDTLEKSSRTILRRVVDKRLHYLAVGLACLLLACEWMLRASVHRRWP